MAVTLTKRQTDKARELIKVERICEELQKCVDGKRAMSATQVRAAQILLDRSMPCLIAQTFSAEDEMSLPMLKIVRNDSSAA